VVMGVVWLEYLVSWCLEVYFHMVGREWCLWMFGYSGAYVCACV
jgi:hypothetical protein